MGKTKSDFYDWSMNFWVGCHSVSPGCIHCYARAQVEGYGRDFDTVGRTKTWNDPIKWQRDAAAAGKIEKVFACSWSDFFHPSADQWRAEAWAIINHTPHLIWDILTKRAELIADRLPEDWGDGYPNVRLGVTVEMKKYLWRIDTLRKIPAKARYVMAEPLLEDLMPDLEQHIEGIQQIMMGGESGNGTDDFRPMDEQWARNIRDLCAAKHITFRFKQHAGPHSQMGTKLDGVEHIQYPVAWDAYVPQSVCEPTHVSGKRSRRSLDSPGQVSLLDGLEDLL